MHATGASILLSLAAAAATLAAADGRPRDPIEMEVLGVVPLESEGASLLVLRQKGARTVLPIFVGRAEGTAIERRLKHDAPPRETSELLERTIAALGGKVTRVDIDGTNGAVFSAHVSLQQGGRAPGVEARPSEAVALALAAQAPIFASGAVVAEAGLSDQELARVRRPRSQGERDDDQLGPVQTF